MDWVIAIVSMTVFFAAAFALIEFIGDKVEQRRWRNELDNGLDKEFPE